MRILLYLFQGQTCQTSPGTTPTKIYSQHSDIRNVANKRPLFRPHLSANTNISQKSSVSDDAVTIVTTTQRDEIEWRSSNMDRVGHGGGGDGFDDEWAEDEFRAEDDLFSITSSTPSSSHREVSFDSIFSFHLVVKRWSLFQVQMSLEQAQVYLQSVQVVYNQSIIFVFLAVVRYFRVLDFHVEV